MDNLNVRFFVGDAREKLRGKDAKSLAVFHTGITVAAALVITLLQFVLAEGIGNTSGLSGLGTRSILETIQTVLHWANMILVPFWGLGFLYASLLWSQNRYARREDLLMGFRRFGPFLSLLLNRSVLAILVMILCGHLSSAAFMLTPAAGSFMELVEVEGADMEALNQMMAQMSWEDTMALANSLLPMLIIWGVLSLVILVPLLYRFRLAEYVILDEPLARGLSSMLISAALLRRRCWKLFRLDLQFWWYYGLKLLCTLLCYGDLLLGILGVNLPVGGEVAALITYGLYLAALFAIEVAFRPQVDTAYAGLFLALKEMGPEQKRAPAVPQNMPWDEE